MMPASLGTPLALPDAGAGEHRRHRTRAVEPDPPAVVAGPLDADARDHGLACPPPYTYG